MHRSAHSANLDSAKLLVTYDNCLKEKKNKVSSANLPCIWKHSDKQVYKQTFYAFLHASMDSVLYLITLPLPELGKVAKNHQKQLTLIIVTESAKIDHMSANYIKLYFC